LITWRELQDDSVWRLGTGFISQYEINWVNEPNRLFSKNAGDGRWPTSMCTVHGKVKNNGASVWPTGHGYTRSLPVVAFAVDAGFIRSPSVKAAYPRKVCMKPNIRARPDALAHCLTSSSKIPLNSTRPFELYSMPLPFLLSSFHEPTYLLPSA